MIILDQIVKIMADDWWLTWLIVIKHPHYAQALTIASYVKGHPKGVDTSDLCDVVSLIVEDMELLSVGKDAGGTWVEGWENRY